jgi:hypothetical protein
MMCDRVSITMLAAAFVMTFAATNAQSQVALDRFVLPGGGGVSSNAGVRAVVCFGQPFVMTSTQGSFKLELGFYPRADCRADLTGDGMLNFFDVSAFINAYNAMDPIADFTDDGAFNFFDVSAFISLFSQGCP